MTGIGKLMVSAVGSIKFVVSLLSLSMVFTEFNCFSATAVPDGSGMSALLAPSAIAYTVRIRTPSLSKPKLLGKS